MVLPCLSLGEVVNSKNESFDIQLKGSGPTPYSRSADGRKVLRSTIREFLCSEAIHHLGIPTTRAGCCITSDDYIMRDMFYDGHPKMERCSIVLRIAPTFLRFGSFEIFKPMDKYTGREGPSFGNKELLYKMLHYTIQRFYPQIYEEYSNKSDDERLYLEFYREVVTRTARLVAQWQCVGFCHGVLNTDNMSIIGLTIDYGPFGFLDRYDPDYVCNSSDTGGRYSYKQQVPVCKWNCMKLAEAIKLALPLDRSLAILDDLYDREYELSYLEGMRKKLGLIHKHEDSDRTLFESLFQTMYDCGSDFTNTFRGLSFLRLPGHDQYQESLDTTLDYLLSQCSDSDELLAAHRPTMGEVEVRMMIRLFDENPDLKAQMDDKYQYFKNQLHKISTFNLLKNKSPAEKKSADSEKWTKWLETYSDRLKKDIEAASDFSSDASGAGRSGVNLDKLDLQRREVMNSANPKYILRNWIAQRAIEKAEKGDFSEVQNVLKILEAPFAEVTTSYSETIQAVKTAEELDTAKKVDATTPVASTETENTDMTSSNTEVRAESAAAELTSKDEKVPTSKKPVEEPCTSRTSSDDDSRTSDYCSKPPQWATMLRVS